MFLGNILDDPIGQIAISILLGFGLATVLRRTCKGNSCVIVRGPPLRDVRRHVYKVEDDCFKYTPYASKCQ